MKPVSTKYCTLMVSLIFFCQAYAQVSLTVTNIVLDAKIIAPISLTNTIPMDFGTISRSSTVDGSVTVSPAGGRTTSGGASVLSSSSFSAAPFTVGGENNASFNLTLPADNAVEMTRTGGSETMEVNGFLHNSTLTLSSSGTETFSVGATLTVNANQIAGDYVGEFSITVAYQ